MKPGSCFISTATETSEVCVLDSLLQMLRNDHSFLTSLRLDMGFTSATFLGS
jgi:hypothetical protein